jgi:hypothetical protein
MNPSAIEICSAVALWSILPSIHQDGSKDHVTQTIFIVAGVLLIATRPIGVVIYVMVSLVSWLAYGKTKPISFFKANKPALITHGVAGTLMVWWYVAVYSFQTTPSLTAGSEKLSLTTQLAQSIKHIPELLDHVVGNFGWLDTPIPRGALWLYVIGILILVATSIKKISQRKLLSLILLCASVCFTAIAIDLNFYAMFGWFGAQGRHIAPLLAGFPLLTLSQFVFGSRVQIATITVWSVVMVWAGLGALRRYTVGISENSALSMFGERSWNPSIGFWISVVILAAATALVAVALVSSRRALSLR